MICKSCGYDSNKSMGKALEDAQKGALFKIRLSKNGIKAREHGHLIRYGIYPQNMAGRFLINARI